MGSADLRPYLDDLEGRIVPAVEEELLAAWRTFQAGRWPEPIFSPRRRQVAPPRCAWPEVTVNKALGNGDAMALQQFRMVSDALAGATGGMLCVRCNYGVGILPTLFGARMFLMADEQNCLPNVWPLDGGSPTLDATLARGIPDLHSNLGGHVFAMGRYFRDLLAPYPHLSRYVHLYHPDLQGPLDVTELLWGSSIFTALLDETERVHAMLDLVVRTYTAFLQEWYAMVPPVDGEAVHWAMLHRGRIMLRDDSAMNLSPAMIQEFVAPYDQRLLKAFGGGCIHYCGRGDHHMPILAHLDSLYGVNLSQPEMNKMESIFHHTVDRGIPLLGLEKTAAQAALDAGRDLHHLVHCW